MKESANQKQDMLTSILNGISAMIYVTDLETDEILFINDYMKLHFGIESDVIGQPCYAVLNEGIDKRCDWCPCHQLDKEPDIEVVWEELNTLTKCHYRNSDRYIDWPNGKKVHIQHCVDITDVKLMQVTLEYNNSLLQAVNKSAVFLLNTDVESYLNDVHQSMKVIGEAAGVDRVYIWKNHSVDGVLHSTQIYEWSGGAESQQDNKYTVNMPYEEALPGLEKLFQGNECLNGVTSQMPLKYQSYFRPQSIVSIIMVPIFIQEQLWGFVGFDDCHNERVFTEREESTLRSVGLLYAHAHQRNEIIQDIQETSAKLEAALEQATAASKAKGDFLSNMSHEMRTPLNAVIGMTAIGKKTNDIEEKNRALNKIGDASSHLLGLISDILDMAKIEADKLVLSPIEYNFEHMLQKVLTVIHFRSDEKQQLMTVNIDKKIPRRIIGDDQRLAQVLTNILYNAVKFTHEGGTIHLDISLAMETDDFCELRIEASDNGIGITPDQQEKLFLAFEQAEFGTSREYGGTGLGLPIAKRIIELMGGQIKVESELGKGAKFIFTIRVGRGPSSLNDENDSGSSGARGDIDDDVFGGLLKGKRLLVVEDVEINREILIALLEDTGLLIDCAENGKEALDIISADPEKYDIVFMDIQMPQMDGLEATRRIRALPPRKRKRLPIVAMTANVFKDDIAACVAAGMDDHLGKPLDIDKVIDKLRMYLPS